MYFTLLPLVAGAVLAGSLQDKLDPSLTPRSLAKFAVFSLLPYTLYDWGRVPANLFFGLPFWAPWFDWGTNITGAPLLSLTSLAAGFCTHLLRGWGMAMSYYILVRRVTLPSAFIFAGGMTVLYWGFFPVWVLAESRPLVLWWVVAWEAHVLFAIGLWYAPRLFANYLRSYKL